jgi:hypothetical protein
MNPTKSKGRWTLNGSPALALSHEANGSAANPLSSIKMTQ